MPFYKHVDEPQASHLYTALNQARAGASRSVAVIIEICHSYTSADRQLRLNEVINSQVSQVVASSHGRFRTTLSLFMYLFVEVYNCIECVHAMDSFKIPLLLSLAPPFSCSLPIKVCGSYITEEQCWELLSMHMASLSTPQPLEGRMQVQQAAFECDVLEQLFLTLTNHVQDIPMHKAN